MNKEFLEAEEIEQIETLDRLGEALSETESPEAKRIRAVLETTSNAGLKATLEERLEELSADNGMDIPDVLSELQDAGFSHAYVLRHGITKIKQQIKWRANNRQRKAEA